MKVQKPLLITIILIALFIPTSNIGVYAQVTTISPGSLHIGGEIIDNYANLTYSMEFSNEASSIDKLAEVKFHIPNDLYLSNVSAIMGNITYWGRVSKLAEAQQIYSEAVESNQSAVLATITENSLSIKINVEAGKSLLLTAFLEGFLTREKGVYKLIMLKDMSYFLEFSLDISIRSTYSSIISSRIWGLDGEVRENLIDGKRLYLDKTSMSTGGEFELNYALATFSSGGKLLTYYNGTDNFFAYLLAPEIQTVEERQPREFIFVIDVSGSMGGERIIQAKEAFSNMIESLEPDDLFNVMAFESKVDYMWSDTKSGTEGNIEDALQWVNDLESGGGTNINDAIVSALDSYDSTTKAVKVITFLSDGAASEGIQDSNSIRQNAISANDEGVIIFSVAFGSGSDEGLMASIAFDSGGEYTVIQPGEEAIEKLGSFYENFATPIALGYSTTYINAFDIAPETSSLQGALYNGSEVLQTGRYDGQLGVSTTIDYANQASDELSLTAVESGSQIERLWAHNFIKFALKSLFVDQDLQLEQKLLDIALYYGLVVPYYTGLTIVLVEDSTDEPTEFIGTLIRLNPVTMTMADGGGMLPFSTLAFIVSIFTIGIVLRRKNKFLN